MTEDWYPGASRSQTWPTDSRCYASGYAAKGCLHTTEGTSWPGYDGGSNAPHFTIQPLTGEVRQHYPIDYPAKALYQPDSPPTNKGRAIQIEIIGTCDPNRKGDAGWNFIPGQTAAQLKGLAPLMRWIEANAGVQRSASVAFRAYPGSYGAPDGRLSSSAWKSYNGWCGHQHVPSNNHGDPGNIDIASLLAGEEDDDVLNADDKEWIDARIDQLDAHTSNQINAHDEQIRTKLNTIYEQLSAQIASLQPKP